VDLVFNLFFVERFGGTAGLSPPSKKYGAIREDRPDLLMTLIWNY